MCSTEDLEPCTVWRQTYRTARKAHECDACGGPIAPKDPYLDHFDVFEGEVSSQKICAPCTIVWNAFSKEHGGAPHPGSLIETLEECIGERDDDSARWRPLLAGILKRWRTTAGGRRALTRRIAGKWEFAAERAQYGVYPRPFVWAPPGGDA